MKNIFIALTILMLCIACGGSQNGGDGGNNSVQENQPYNITILLDLSDRINRDLTPSQSERDISVILNIVNIFKNRMDTFGAFNAKDKIRVMFYPTPDDSNINTISESLNVDLSKLESAQKKAIYDAIYKTYESNLNKIYDKALEAPDFSGSDIWRFFKNSAKTYCIDPDTSYRNILVIFTDGYLFHEDSKENVKNRTSYITHTYFNNCGFTNNTQWKEKFDSQDFGLIIPDETYSSLDILVLEINPIDKFPKDEDIIRAYLEKWFSEMKVENFKIYKTDIPSNTKTILDQFFK